MVHQLWHTSILQSVGWFPVLLLCGLLLLLRVIYVIANEGRKAQFSGSQWGSSPTAHRGSILPQSIDQKLPGPVPHQAHPL